MKSGGSEITETDIPARLDRLPWGRFHVYLVVALGITWALDGLEVTLAGAVSTALKSSPMLHFNDFDVGLAGSAYIAGAVCGGLFFGWLTDRFGRRYLFFITLGLYVLATFATAFSWNFTSFALFRFLTGAGIGGEYTAINSTIQEFTPARVRGRTDLAINGSFWLGALLGSVGSATLLDPAIVGPEIGWRLSFLIGAILGAFILLLRVWLPESPRWLMTHGRLAEAEQIVSEIEAKFPPQSGADLPRLKLRTDSRNGVVRMIVILLRDHRRSAFVGFSLMVAQAFFYNAIFFTYVLVLTDFYHVPGDRAGFYIIPFAIGNFLGPICLGGLFDRLGRRVMIPFTYAASGLLLVVSGWAFQHDYFTATTQTLAWTVVFFFASAAASSAYLTVSEVFPLEMRAIAIALFYALGTGIGGIAAPALLGGLIDTGSRDAVYGGYLLGAALMLAAAVIHRVWGIASERQSLEAIARPLSATDA